MMALGSKFAHLWTEETSQSSPSSSESSDGKEDDSLKVTMEFLRSIDQESLDYLRRDCDTSDLFASFGYDTSFGGGTGGSLGQLGMSPTSTGRQARGSTSAADRAFAGLSSSSWQSENVSGGTSPFRNISDASLGAHVNCSPFQSPNRRGDLCHSHNFHSTKSDGESLVASPGNGQCSTPYDPKCSSNALTGLDGPPSSSLSPVPPSSLDSDALFNIGNLFPKLGFGGSGYETLTQTLTYIAAQLAELGLGGAHGESSPRSPWGSSNRMSGFGNSMNSETMQKWIKLLRNIQDALTLATDMEATQRAQMIELSCTLQKQLLYYIMGEDAPKSTFGAGVGTCDLSNESQIQAGKFLREHSGFLPQSPFVWRGVLPRRDYQNAVFSCKVFLGGLPYDMTESGMIQAFKLFGNVKVEWPGKDSSPVQHKGYAYVIFENEKQVKIMLQNCTMDYSQEGKWFCKMSSRRVRMKDVEVIPWALSDSNFALRPTSKLEPRLTIFVGALHGMLNAEGLAIVMEALFGGVVHAGIDTDRNKYPIGSGRVSFDNFHSYFTAINGAFVEIKSSKFSKVVQLDPYLEDSTCSHCSLQQAPYFCRSLNCFRYYCRTCFELAHASEALRSHRPLMRNPNKKSQSNGFSSPTCCSGIGGFGSGGHTNGCGSGFGGGGGSGGGNSGSSFTYSPTLARSSGTSSLSSRINYIQGSRFIH